MNLNEMILAVSVIVLSILTHELGHYLFANKYGWKPVLKLYKNGLFSGLMVETETIKSETVDDFFYNIIKLEYFAAGGIFGIIPFCMAGIIFFEYRLQFMVCINLFLLYTIWEILTVLERCRPLVDEEIMVKEETEK